MNENPTKIPKWLKRIQQNSWEPEILLSGFVLVGLTKIPSYLDDLQEYFTIEVTGSNFQGVFTGLKIAAFLLVAGLITHLFLRAVWIGFVGLSYTFPKGIQTEKLRYQPAYIKHIERIPPMEYMIDRLEKVCSSLFALCFFIVMVLFGLLVAITIVVLLLIGIGSLTNGWLYNLLGNSVDPIILTVVFIVSFDFITLGFFRYKKWTARIYYPFHVLIGWLTLAFLYRPIYYTIATNVRRMYLSLGLLLFFGLSLGLQIIINQSPEARLFSKLKIYNSKNTTTLFSGYYADRNENWTSYRAFIPSPILKGRFLELTVKDQISHEKFMESNCPEFEDDPMLCVSEYFRVYIDGQRINDIKWFNYFYQKKSQKTFLTFLDTDSLASGEHEIGIKLKKNPDSIYYCQIPFFKE